MQLEGLENRRPSQLSGGQQQRVAIARALVFEPELVLMDEPLGALDRRLREEMQYEIRRIHSALGVTVVYVTHDQQEAMTLSDRVAVSPRPGRYRNEVETRIDDMIFLGDRHAAVFDDLRLQPGDPARAATDHDR